MQNDAELRAAVQELTRRVAQLEAAARLSAADAGRALLSGALPRQRVHWTQEIGHTNRLAVLGLIGIWTLFLRSSFGAIEVALAGGLSSLLLGLWRVYARHLDNQVASLYPLIVYYEEGLGIGIQHSSLRELRRKWSSASEVRRHVCNRTMGHRGHLQFDWLALVGISAMAAVVWSTSSGIFCCQLRAPFHPTGCLLALNAVGLALVLCAMNCFQTNRGTLYRAYQSIKARRHRRRLAGPNTAHTPEPGSDHDAA